MKKGFLKSISESAKIKYTTVGIIFTALVIAVIILANAVISAFASNHKFYFDMTDEQVYTMSDPFKALMDDNFEKTGAQVEIIFPYDKSEADNTEAISYIHSTAKLLEQRYSDNISISYHDIIKEFTFYNELIKKGNSDETPTSQTLIIARKDKDGNLTGEYFVKNMATFFSRDENGQLYGYDGEYVFASSIIRLTLDENPTVYFTSGHDESIEYDANNKNKATLYDKDKNAIGLAKMLEDIGFSVKLLDRVELEETGVPSDARSVIIYNPESDFSNKEMDNIGTYFTQRHGNVMCFVSYNNQELRNLRGHIEILTGITIVSGDMIKGDASGTIRAEVPSNKATENYYPSLLKSSASKAIFKNAGYLEIDERMAGDGNYAFGAGIRTISLLQSASSETLLSSERKNRTLMAISSSERYQDQTDYVYSYMLVCPSDGFATEEYLYTNANQYPNRKILFSILHSTMSLQVPMDLNTKPFIEYNVDITQKKAAATTVVMTLLMPALVVVCGTVVIIRRKRR